MSMQRTGHTPMRREAGRDHRLQGAIGLQERAAGLALQARAVVILPDLGSPCKHRMGVPPGAQC